MIVSIILALIRTNDSATDARLFDTIFINNMLSIIGGAVSYFVFGMLFLAAVRILSCIGFGSYLKKKKIVVGTTFTGEDVSRSAIFLQDALVIKERPVFILVYFARAIGTFSFSIFIGAFSYMTVFSLVNLIVALDAQAAFILWIVLAVVMLLFLTLTVIPFIIFKRVMSNIFEDKIYK